MASKYISDIDRLLKEWDYEKNSELCISPFKITTGSNKKVWWRCDNGHSWFTSPKHMLNSKGCPFCTNSKIIPGFNDLATLHPELAREWHKTLNGEISPHTVGAKSNKSVWWQCSKGHEWKSVIASRAEGVGCPYCSNKKILMGFNDLRTTHPQLAQEWHPTKNGSLKPTDIVYGSGKKVWWKCEKGHEWQVSPNKRTSDKTGCPYCSNKKVLAGFNDLATTHPNLLPEWNFERNGDLQPADVTSGTHIRIWWKCEKGHEWQAAPSNRIKNKGCPECAKQYKTSLPEQAIYYYIKKHFVDAINTDNDAIGMELDVYIPSLKTAIEYDGVHYHNNSSSLERDLRKNKLCKDNGIHLIRVREEGLCSFDDCECLFRKNLQTISSLNLSIANILQLLGARDDSVNVDYDYQNILNQFLENELLGSLATISPELAKEWHPTKNGSITPEMLKVSSSRKVWWKCQNGHEWQASLHNRSKGKSCPYCSGRKAIPGETDLLTLRPDVASFWNYEKNADLRPCDITPYSSIVVWWKCEKGHEWQSTVNNKASNKDCPFCSNKRVLKGFNDLATTHPELAKEWHPTKNNGLKHSDIIAGSGKKIWWKCEQGHEWQTQAYVRLLGMGCPYCAGNGKTRVINIDTGEEFDSFSAAARKYNGGPTQISNCCKGKQKTAYGYHWSLCLTEKTK